jgi:acetoin utilization deacetylase AcuC-like enzyme
MEFSKRQHEMNIPIFYDKRQSVSGIDSYSPSASKPERLVWLASRHGFSDVRQVTPVTKEDLYLVHRKDHVDRIFALMDPNGFENCDPRIPESCLWTIGSLLGATRCAIESPTTPVLSPTSGFHHSGYSIGSGGFCTFNGLMVVAAKLLQENPDFKCAILDLDMHEGNGTENILQHKPELSNSVLHLTQGKYFYGDNPRQEALEFQAWLKESIDEINAFRPDVVIAQLGADPHINDPLGGFLDDKQLSQRDKMVFDNINAPTSFCIAGGYQANPGGTIETDPVLRVHLNTLRAARGSIQHRQHLLETT